MNRILAPPWLATMLIVMLTTLLLLAPPLMSPASPTVTASVLSWYPQPGTPDPLIPIAVAVVTLTVLYLAGTIPARNWRRRRHINLFTHGLYHLGTDPLDLYTCEPQRVGAGGMFTTMRTACMISDRKTTMGASSGGSYNTRGKAGFASTITARSMPLLI